MRGVSLVSRRGIASKKDISVIVTDTIPGIGVKGEIKSVRPGFARNQLFPKKMAVYDTPVNRIKMEEFTKDVRLEEREAEAKRLQAIARLETVTVRLKRQVVATDVKGKETLHAPIFARDVIKALWRQHFIAVLEEDLQLSDGGISTLGQHTLTVNVGSGAKRTTAKLNVVLEAR